MVARDSCGDTTGLLRGVLRQQVVVAVSFRVEDAIAFVAMARDRQSTHMAAGGRRETPSGPNFTLRIICIHCWQLDRGHPEVGPREIIP